jgi:hypothetical protein
MMQQCKESSCSPYSGKEWGDLLNVHSTLNH